MAEPVHAHAVSADKTRADDQEQLPFEQWESQAKVLVWPTVICIGLLLGYGAAVVSHALMLWLG